jgi:hypothetical protein
MGSNPSIYWMDVSDDSYYIRLKRKIIEVAKWATPKPYFKQIRTPNPANLDRNNPNKAQTLIPTKL